MRKSHALGALAAIMLIGLWARLEHREQFREQPRFWGVTGTHLAMSHALSEGRRFRTDAAEKEAAQRFVMEEPGGFTRSLSEFDASVDRLRAEGRAGEDRFYSGDQGGWGVLIRLARMIPGVDSLYGVSGLQIVIDLGALLLLFPIGRFVFGRDEPALAACLWYAIYPPIGFAAAEPFRDGWPGFATIYATAALVPAWKRGPQRLVTSAGWFVAAGVIAGMATYVRTTAAAAPVALTLLTLLAWRKLWPSAVGGAVIAAAMVLTLAPWGVSTLRGENVYALATNGNGHSFLTGLGEEAGNPVGLSFDDAFVSAYVRRVCGYEVEYGTFAYSAACNREARRFIRDNTGWYAEMLRRRVTHGYLVREVAPRMKWGRGTDVVSKPLRSVAERWTPLLGVVGCLAGLFVFPRAWLPLVWILHFMAFTLPFQGHPRLTLGAEWALGMGCVMLVAAPVSLWRRRKKPPGVRGENPPLRGAAILGGGAALVCLVVFALMQAFPPRAPEPALDWRAGLADPNPQVRLATLDAVRPQLRNAIPVLMAAHEHPDAAVQAKAVEVRNSFRDVLAYLSWADGLIGVQPPPQVEARVIQAPGTRDGYALRLTAPQNPKRPVIHMAWPLRDTPGVYKIGFTSRLDVPLSLAFYENDLGELRDFTDLTDKGYPMTRFRYAEIQYTPPPQDSAVTVMILIRGNVPDTGQPITLDFDDFQVWFEAAVGD